MLTRLKMILSFVPYLGDSHVEASELAVIPAASIWVSIWKAIILEVLFCSTPARDASHGP